MVDLIPLLQDLLFVDANFSVPDGFVQSFVTLHFQDWENAQDHWERIVEKVLDTDAVDQDASGLLAMDQAVRAAAILLHRLIDAGCPLCPKSDPPSGGVHDGR